MSRRFACLYRNGDAFVFAEAEPLAKAREDFAAIAGIDADDEVELVEIDFVVVRRISQEPANG